MGGAAAGVAAVEHAWLLLTFSAGLLAYANFLAFLRRRGGARARLGVGAMTAASLLAWLYNFLHH